MWPFSQKFDFSCKSKSWIIIFYFLEAVGTTIDIEKQLYQPEELEPLTPSPSPSTIAVQPTTSINITCASPSPSILKHTGSGSFHHRRGSGNNNSNFASSTSRRSSGNVSFNSRRTSLQRNGLTGNSALMLK